MNRLPLIIEPEARAAELVSLWNACAGTEFPLDERLFLQQLRLDTDPRRCFAFVEADGTISAAALAKRAARTDASGRVPEAGYLSWLMVQPGQRGRGLASAVVGQAAAWLSSLGASSVRLGGDHYHLLPGRPLETGPGYQALGDFAAKLGFKAGKVEYDLSCHLPATPAPLVEDRSGGRYSYGQYRSEQREALLRFMRASFAGRWTHEMVEALDAGMRYEDLVLAVDNTDSSVVGFSRIYDGASTILGPGVYWRGLMGTNPGGLGPIGVDSSRRGAGLGLGLLSYSVLALRNRGIGTMAIDWTDLVDFYGKIGFKVWKRYEPMAASLASDSPLRLAARPRK